MTRPFFLDRGETGPILTDALVARAEATLGRRLPLAYVALLRERNGGVPERRCISTERPTSWATNHIELSTLTGIGYKTDSTARLVARTWSRSGTTRISAS